jgi:hypothetical protein
MTPQPAYFTSRSTAGPNCLLRRPLTNRPDLGVLQHAVDRDVPREPASLAHFVSSRRSLVKYAG